MDELVSQHLFRLAVLFAHTTAPEKLEQRAKPKRRKQNHNPDEIGGGGVGVTDGGARPPTGLLPFGGAAAGAAPGFVPSTSHSQQSQHLHGGPGGPRMPPPPPHQFGEGVGDDFMVGPQSLTNVSTPFSLNTHAQLS